MKVTHCSVFYSDSFKGGIQNYIANVVRHQGKEIDVDVLTTASFADSSRAAGVRRAASLGVIFRTPISPTYPLLARGSDSDLLHFHSPSPLMDLSAVTSGKDYVVSVHNILPDETPHNMVPIRLARMLLLRSMAGAGRVVVYNSDLLRQFLADRDTLERILDKTVEIPPGLDRERFRNRGLPRNNDVLFVAHLRPEKGLHVLVEAMGLLRRKDSRLVVMVDVKYFRGYFDKVIAKARGMLGDRLVVVANPSDEQILDGYGRCGCVVCPSTGLESWNFVMMEAAGCAAPIVRSDLEGMGWLREPACEVAAAGDPADLAKKISLALEGGGRLGERAEREVMGYSWEDTAKRLIKVYRELKG